MWKKGDPVHNHELHESEYTERPDCPRCKLEEAAPTLLEACKELQSSAKELSNCLDDGLAVHEWGNTNRVDNAVIKAKAAIEKATK